VTHLYNQVSPFLPVLGSR